MASKSSITAEVISQAESYGGIQAGIVPLKEVLEGPSHQAIAKDQRSTAHLGDAQIRNWPEKAKTVLVLGLKHSRKNPRLDYWEQGDSWGNRRLREISELLKKWLREKYNLGAYPLSYYVEKGGLFLKDAAVLSGMGIIGQNNLLLNPEWGPKIRFRSILLEGDFQKTEILKDFHPCDTCDVLCQKACPMKAFPLGKYTKSICFNQMNIDMENEAPEGEMSENGRRNMVIKYCRACELSCPIGA